MVQTFATDAWAILIREKLEKQGISGREGARRCGVAVATFNRAANGYTPSVETYTRINEWLQL